MSELAPFVPFLAPELGSRPGSHWTSIEGSMLSADISGFTALSEKLAAKGKAGAEEITDLLNTCFTALINAAYGRAGEVIKFGGDALLVLFRGDDHQVRSALAALDMQNALRASVAARRSNLTMTVGVAEGPFDVFLVGEPRRELLITGPNASEVIELEGTAGKGATLMGKSIAEAFAHRVTTIDAGGLVLDEIEPVQRDVTQDLTPYVPGSLLEQLGAFSGLGGEHRLVTVGFVMVTGVDELLATDGGDVVAGHLTSLVNAVRDACVDFQVTFLHSDIAGSGAKLILAAGAPLTSGADEDAMLHATLAIARHETPLTVKIGVQRGRVFAGFLGSKYRRAYTVMGDTVNTAARFLGQARPGDVIAGDEVITATQAIFDAERLEPFMVKGKSVPLIAHRVARATDSVRTDDAGQQLVGRRKELAAISSALRKSSSMVEVSGPAGIGKSRLIEAGLSELSADNPPHLFRTGCTQYGSSSPYSAFRPMLRRATGIELSASADSAGRTLRDLVRTQVPELTALLPLLAAPFGASATRTPEAEAIDPELRRARIHDVVVQFFDALLTRPTVLVMEDVHWIDDASSELLSHLVRAVATRPWTVLTTRRDEDANSNSNGDKHLRHVRSIALTAMKDDEIKAIAIGAGQRAMSDSELDDIIVRASGNPLFASELARTLTSADGATLPESIEGLISTRIDGLAPETRLLLRIASVFGQSFDRRDVEEVAGSDAAALDSVTEFVEMLDDSRYSFSQAMYRDAIYEGLPYRRRKELHKHVGTYLESRAETPDDIASLLSVHFTEARQWAEAWRYSMTAGDQAALHYAHAEAAQVYDRAVAASGRLRSLAPTDRSQAAEKLGDSLLVIGHYDDAYAAFGKARRDADPLADVDLMRRQGMVRDRQGSLGAAIRWYERCLDHLPDDGGERDERQVRLDVALAYAAARHRQGKFEDCLEWARRAEAEAVGLDDKSSQAKALDRLHVAATYLGLPEAETYGPAALRLHEQLGDYLSQARILDNMGIQAYFAYDWDEALVLYAKAAEAGKTAGDVIEANLGRANAAEVLSDRGLYDDALSEFSDVLRNWSAAGWSFGVAGTQSNIALAQGRAGRSDDEPYAALLEVQKVFEELGAEEFSAEATVRLAEIAVHLGDDDQALRDADVALTRLSDPQSRARIHRTIALAQLSKGNTEAAAAAIDTSIALGEESDAPYELGFSHRVAAMVPGRDHTEHEIKARETLDRLGVVALPHVFERLGHSAVSV